MENQTDKKPRILCLHGFRTSAAILKKLVERWPETILEKLDLVFLDAPFPDRGKSDVEGIFDPPYYDWFQANEDFTEYTNFEECLAYIEDYMIEHGPFDGVLGFSQGAILSAALPGMQKDGAALTKVPNTSIKFLVIISGAKFGVSKFGMPKLAANAFASPIQCPSIHFIGETDFMKEESSALLESFVEPVVIHHSRGHTVPRLGSMSAVCGASPMIPALSLDSSKSTSPIYLLPRSPNRSSFGQRHWRVPIELLRKCGYYTLPMPLRPRIPMAIRRSKSMPPPAFINGLISKKCLCKRCNVESTKEWTKAADFPIINPAFSGNKNRYIHVPMYAATTSGSRRSLPHFPFDTVVKLDSQDQSVRTWTVGPRRFIGEPIFVPKGDGEDDGYLLVIEYGVAMQRYLTIMDPKRIGESDAVVARLEVPKHLNFPLGFHGFWADDKPSK